jgi:predicted metal-dependent peptidase
MGIDTKTFQPKELTEKELLDMREEVHDRVIVARVGLLLRHPFFGNMATRLIVKHCDDWCPTAATDGRHLYYNTQFFNAMSNKEIEFVIAHEILHCVFDHLGRREDRDPMLSNIAQDYVVNNTLVRDRIGTMPKLVDCFQDWKYDNWAFEEVYDDLFQQAEENGKELIKQLGELLDEHVDWESAEGDPADDGDSEGSSRPVYSKDDLKKIRDEVKENMMSAAQAAGAGNLPKEVKRLIKNLTEPQMNWREIIRTQIQSIVRNDYTFTRPSRKGWHTNAVLPGMNFEETIDIAVALDMSGSIGDSQAKDFLSEVKGIMDQYQDYNIKLWCFDTEVYGEEDFTAGDGKDLVDYDIRGGGGTDFDANFTYMKDNSYVPKKLIMFTDGYPWGSWGDENYCDTVFLIHSNSNKNIEAPFGTTIHYESTV